VFQSSHRMKNNTTKNRTTETSNAQSALAELNAQIAELQSRRVTLAEPLKIRHAEMRTELVNMETQIRELDPTWKPEPTKPKAETKITEIITANGSPMSMDEIVAAVGDLFTPWKVKNTVKKKSLGTKALFTLADGKYTVKAAA
jgi:hypothetical protein